MNTTHQNLMNMLNIGVNQSTEIIPFLLFLILIKDEKTQSQIIVTYTIDSIVMQLAL
ncbi:hypothetical protein PE36_18810 [Moritella sp. PE36]|nr:hypothetical protein PE36_18810 [Moritella sp. PE36]